MKLRDLLGIVAMALTSLTVSSEWKGSKKDHSHKMWKHISDMKQHMKSEGRMGLIWIRGHPVWGSVTSTMFKGLISVDNAFKTFPCMKYCAPAEEVCILKRSFDIMKAASMSLPYSSDGMIQVYNSYKFTINREMQEAITTLSRFSARWIMESQSSLKAQKVLLSIYDSMKDPRKDTDNELNTNMIMPEEHTKPDKRKFYILALDADIFSSEAKAFEISTCCKVWTMLPTHYSSIVSDVFNASNGSDRPVEVIKDLSCLSFYLEVLMGYVKHKIGLNDYEIKMLYSMYTEFQAALQRLVQKLDMPAEKKGLYSAVITMGNTFNLMDALANNKSAILRQNPLSEE
jgi:hypothetical protein